MRARSVFKVARGNDGDRLEQEVRREINAGILKPHDRLPGEKKLEEQYQMGLAAVRAAINRLKQDGFLYSKARSGIYVADVAGRESAESHSGEGLHAFEIRHGAVCRLKFLALGWNADNKARWEELCRGVTRIHPSLVVEPVFPGTGKDYDAWRERCDIFMTNTLQPELYGPERRLELMARSEIAELPLSERYVEAVAVEGGVLGIPITGSLLVGAINSRLVPVSVQHELSRAASWEMILPLLARVSAEHPPAAGFNFHPARTLNLWHHLIHVAGAIMDPVSRQMLVTGEPFRQAMACLEASRGKAFKVWNPPDRFLAPQSCLAFLDWTAMLPRSPSFFAMTPWLFPLGSRGTYLEGLNFGAISHTTPYPEECRIFLRYLVSDPVQGQLAKMIGEHPVSSQVADPFAGYDADWKRVLNTVKQRSQPCREYTPGYAEFMELIFFPLAERFFYGEINARDLLARLDERGTRFFSPARQTSAAVP